MAGDRPKAPRSSDTSPRREEGGHLGTPEGVGGASGSSPSPILVPPRRIEKPWGHEVLWAETDEYAGKILSVRAGEALSLHFHEERDKTLLLIRGQITLEVGAGVSSLAQVPVREGEAFRIRPGVLHRVTAQTDVEMMEVSTPELDDIVRIRDRYGRVDSSGGDRT